jgi:uncharacterized membrane protein YdfJ with MMPL/SSD domain
MKTRVIQSEPDEPTTPLHGDSAQPRTHRNIAARMARWSAQHRKKAILGWLAFAVVLFAVNLSSPVKTIVPETSGPGEAGRADTILYDDFKQPAGEEVLIQSRQLTTSDPAFKAAVQAVVTGVSNLDAVAKVKSPFAPGNSGFISADKHSALVRMEIRGPSEDAADKIDPVAARVAEVQKAHPELYIGSFGESTLKALQASFGEDLKRAGLFSIPLTLIILLVAFGAVVAAGIPLLLGLTAVLATLGIVAGISHVLPMADTVSAIILLIGLAVGVDYTLFYLKREREERAAGRSEAAALEAAAAKTGSGGQSSIASSGARSCRPYWPVACWWRSRCPRCSSKLLSPASIRIRKNCWEPITESRLRTPARKTQRPSCSRCRTLTRRPYGRPSRS